MPGYSGASSRTQAASFMCPGCWEEFLNPLPLGIRVVSFLLPLSRTHAESSSQLRGNSSSLILSRNLGLAWALTQFPARLHGSRTYRAVSPVTERNLWSLIPS